MKIEALLKTNKPLELSKQVVTNLLYTGNLVSLKLNCALKPFDITIQQFNVLRILRGQNGKSLNLKEVQERMINTNSNTTRLIDKLVSKAYVKRITDEKNRRKTNISITDKGLVFLAELDVVIDKKEDQKIIANLNHEERLLLNSLLEKIRATNEAS